MQVSYASVNQCLSDWEFCPLCNKRTNIDIDFYDAAVSYYTTCDNTNLNVSGDEGLIYSIHLKKNKVSFNTQFTQPFLRICCKNFHWGITYDIINTSEVQLELNKLSFFIKDKKTQIVYNLISNYPDNEMTITLSNDTDIFQEIKQEVIDFTHLSKKYVIKKIRALCLLA